ncbi:MAG: hypothetical protein Q9213_005841 [Squamulea squamosa]
MIRKGAFARLSSKLRSRSNETSTFTGTQVHPPTTGEEDIPGDKLDSDSKSDNASLDKYYVPIDSFEGRHRYDPKATWTLEEEKSLIRKLDLRVCAYCCFMFFALQIDRSNISQALSDNFLDDLGMNTNDYNTGQTIFFVSFLAAELPSQLVSKKIGPDNWIPIQMISWSIVACCQAKLTGRATFFLTRSLLGIVEGGEGSDGFQIILANRIIRDDPSKGDMHNRQAVTPRLLWQALKDYDMLPIYLLGFTWTIPHQCATAYLTLVLRGLKFDTFETNLLTVPAYTLFIIQLIFWTWFSEKINDRYLIILMCQIYMFPILVALEVLPAGAAYAWSRYVLNMLLVGYPYVHAIIVAMTSRNAGSVRTRTVGTALYNMSVQASNIISSNIYREHDKPLYRTGNQVLLGLIAWNIVLIILSKLYYMSKNSQREKVWQGMSEAERANYLETTEDKGNKRLDFRFVH